MEQVQEKKYIFNDTNSILFNRDETAGITLLSNVNLMYTRFHIYKLNEFPEIFYLDINENAYVYKKNTKIKYSKEIVETAISTFISFILNKNTRFNKAIDNDFIEMYIPAEEEAPLILSTRNHYVDWCLLIAPRISGDWGGD